jgi:hypothetical protein
MDISHQACSYDVQVSEPTHEMRVVFTQGGIQVGEPLEFKNSEDAYQFAHRILRGYDKLEGIQ